MVATSADWIIWPNQARRMPASPKTRWKCGSMAARSSSVSLTSNTCTRLIACLLVVSEAATAPPGQRPAVRVDQRVVDRPSPPGRPGLHPAGVVRDGPAGRPLAGAVAVPGLERGGLPAPPLEPHPRIDQVGVVAGRAAKVLAPQPQAQLPGEHPGAVAEPGRVARLPRIAGRVEHRGGQLGVVGPRPAVEVVGADRGPDVVDHAHLGVDVDRG